MLYLPFVTISDGAEYAHVFTGLEADGETLFGFDPVEGTVYEFEPDQIQSLISIDPAAVLFGVDASFREQKLRMVANPARAGAPRWTAKGAKFPMLPAGTLSGYPVASKTIKRLRERGASVEHIRMSALFAVSTVRVEIEKAEESFDCFYDLYRKYGDMPGPEVLKRCFFGLQNTKAATFRAVYDYAPVVHEAMSRGLRDRELRRYLCAETEMPPGLGIAKLSFTLALVGQDTVCLDARLLNKMIPQEAKRNEFIRSIQKTRTGNYTETSIRRYEALEAAFLRGNPHYDSDDPIGAARAQWLSWEAVGGAGTTHATWMKTVR